ncbi:SRPBCC family protein [Salinibacterium sp. M195]|uniref:SRPBCC family protein n=1 Tax=Salinibacterium sp. M195 TaxID=2583374 RepID=UPI001C63344C|nr:SRPBCC family protein [Salinibacterium sp. M195]QYH35104.1 SRPBCC family protein [Salinibacterium sp. M195]
MPEGSGVTKILGSLREENGAGVVHVEDVYGTNIDDLWSAITEPSRLARWIVTVDGDLTIGGEFNARFTSGWEGLGRIDICEPSRHLRITTWSDDDAPGVIDVTLVEEPAGTRLIVEESGLPLDVYHHHGAGWQTHIEDLAAYLEGRKTSDWGARASELSTIYREMAAGLSSN